MSGFCFYLLFFLELEHHLLILRNKEYITSINRQLHQCLMHQQTRSVAEHLLCYLLEVIRYRVYRYCSIR